MTDRLAAMAGPLGPLAVGFQDELSRLGYKDRPADAQVGLLLHLSDWLEEERLSPGELTSTRVAEFLRARQHQGHTRLVTPKGVGPLLGYLRRVGAVPEPSRPVPHDPIDQMVVSYHEYLVGQRGLAPAVVVGYEAVARMFLEDVADRDRCELATVTPGDVTNFVRRACSGRLSVRNLVSPLRSFLRFVHLQGITSVPLAGVVPSVAEWSAAGLPKALAPGEVAALMSSCDRDTALGGRDYAILALLVRLGLRAGEVAALCLEDVDWRVGEVLVHGKGRRDERLPLPADVGEAVVDYLRRGRPRTESRAVFVRALAPVRALSATGVERHSF